MKRISKRAGVMVGLLFIVCTFQVQANLNVQIVSTKTIGKKSVIKMELKNDFAEKVESARMQVLLFDDEGKMVGQASKWVIGGAKDRPALGAGAATAYNFVVDTDRPFTKKMISFNQIILEGGKNINPVAQFKIVEKEK